MFYVLLRFFFLGKRNRAIPVSYDFLFALSGNKGNAYSHYHSSNRVPADISLSLPGSLLW